MDGVKYDISRLRFTQHPIPYKIRNSASASRVFNAKSPCCLWKLNKKLVWKWFPWSYSNVIDLWAQSQLPNIWFIRAKYCVVTDISTLFVNKMVYQTMAFLCSFIRCDQYSLFSNLSTLTMVTKMQRSLFTCTIWN